MPLRKSKEHKTIGDLKKVNGEILDLYKEIRKEAKLNQNKIALASIDRVDLDINYRAVVIKDLTPEQTDDVVFLTSLIKEALLDAQELLRKGTEYGVQLAFHRIENMVMDRRIAKSPFLIDTYRDFEKNLWNVTKLRELAYGQIYRLKEKQDIITKTALEEKDSMMRVRYFEDIRVLEKDILRLENEAHSYSTVQESLHSEEVLKNVLKNYSTSKKDLISLTQFEETIKQYEGK